MEQEIWRDIEGYEGRYQISNLGRARSLDLNVQNHLGWRTIKGRILGKKYNKENYVSYTLCKDKVMKTISARVLVAKSFPEICGKWFEGCHIHHINHITYDDRAENLIVLTSEEHHNLHKDSEITKNKNKQAAINRWQRRKENIAV